jgi:hypothetical protein
MARELEASEGSSAKGLPYFSKALAEACRTGFARMQKPYAVLTSALITTLALHDYRRHHRQSFTHKQALIDINDLESSETAHTINRESRS